MSSIAFCRATSGFSVHVDTNKLRTATARSFAIIVGLPTCRHHVVCFHAYTSYNEGAKLAMQMCLQAYNVHCPYRLKQIVRHLTWLCMQALLMTHQHCVHGIIRLLAARSAQPNMVHTPKAVCCLQPQQICIDFFYKVSVGSAVCMPHAYVNNRFHGFMPYL